MTYLVKDFLGRRGKKGDIGLELEVEGDNLPSIKTAFWSTKGENSLREGGLEYTTNGPLTMAELPYAIKWVTEKLGEPLHKVRLGSPRTSTHVHTNVLYHTPVEYWTQATAYWLLENLLFTYCDDYRKGNAFALRLKDAEGVLGYCTADLRRDRPFLTLGTDNIRYCGQNLAATIKFGSIEYRGLDLSIDQARLGSWTIALNSLSTNCKQFKNPSDLMDSHLKGDILSQLLGEEFSKVLKKNKNWKDLIEENEGSICKLAYYHSWSDWSDQITKTLSTKGKPDIKYQENDFDDPIQFVRQA